MEPCDPFFRWTELDATTFPEWRDRITSYAPDTAPEPRSYPGYPSWPLPLVRSRVWPPLSRALLRRRSAQTLGTALPEPRILARLLRFSHGATSKGGRGPVPSAGSLQALELYVVVLSGAWLPTGVYHYDRCRHCLAQVVLGADRSEWAGLVPSLRLVSGGAMLWLLVGDGRRMAEKYAERGCRFLLLEAGHLMQNLCLLSAGLGLCTLPLGGLFERAVARRLALPSGDLVLYAGACG
jgi:SagB-type dehydrogenase family enzyme